MNKIDKIIVKINFGGKDIPVGTLAKNENTIYFEYDRGFLDSKLEISPVRLPLQNGLIQFDPEPFEGLCGLFNDSLPDGWGRLLFDRYIRSQGGDPKELSPLDRLAYTGANGLGALIYEPDYTENNERKIDLDVLSEKSQDILEGSSDDVIDELLVLNGSSAGARPKALIGVDKTKKNIIHGANELADDFEHWMVKFDNTGDGNDAGAVEYVYALMAKESGIDMPDVHLFPANKGAGYFAIKRFDRENGKRYHTHTACGLLHSDFRVPSLDYDDLLTLTGSLTKDVNQVEKMYRLAVFNVLAYNRDDHSKNFSFLMDETGQWKLSPAYDLTYSSGVNGEQSTMMLGEGANPGVKELLKLGRAFGINNKEKIIEQTQDALFKWKKLATEYGVSKSNIKKIGDKIIKM